MKRCANGTRRVENACKRQPPKTLGAVGVHVGTKSALWKRGYGRKVFPWRNVLFGAAFVGVGAWTYFALDSMMDNVRDPPWQK